MGKRRDSQAIDQPVTTEIVKTESRTAPRDRKVIKSYVSRRQMRFFPLTEAEFYGLAYINTEICLLLAVGPALGGLSIAAAATLATLDSSSQPMAVGVHRTIAISFFILAVGIGVRYYFVHKQKKSELERLVAIATDEVSQD